MSEQAPYDLLRHRDLEQIAVVWLRCAKAMMQSGSRGAAVHEGAALMAQGLNVKLLGLRIGYASITITLASGGNTITRMITVEHHGVNHRLNQAVRQLVRDVAHGTMTVAELGTRLDTLSQDAPKHRPWLVALAVGLACAAFGEVLGTDPPAFLVVFFASSIGQAVRRQLHLRGMNIYVVSTAVALVAASLAGFGARLCGSQTVDSAMVAATLLLVPGVAATNAQADVMDGYPTLGSARAVSVIMTMAFVATGLWLAQMFLRMTAVG